MDKKSLFRQFAALSMLLLTSTIFAIGEVQAQAPAPAPVDAEASFAKFRHAEQVQSTGNYVLTNPSNIPGWLLSRIPFIRGLEFYGDLPEEFRPSGGQLHELVVLLIPQEDMGAIRRVENDFPESLRRAVFVERNGKTYVRFFILPLPANLEYYKEEIAKYPRDDVKWLGWQQASSRSVDVHDADLRFGHFTVKMDLNLILAGGSRLIKRKQVELATVVSEMIGDARKTAKGNWDYMTEPLATSSPGDKGGNIFRTYSATVTRGESFLIPLFALVNGNRFEMWLDSLAKADELSRQDFLEKRLVPSLVDCFAELSLRFGLTPELHQQNTLIQVNARTGRFEKIVVRDMDAFRVDLEHRDAMGYDSRRAKALPQDILEGSNFSSRLGDAIHMKYL